MSGTEILRLRQRLGWTQTQLAATLHVSTASLSDWERGVKTPDPYRGAVLQQIKARLDAADQAKREEFMRGMAAAALGLGIGGLLTYLFTED